MPTRNLLNYQFHFSSALQQKLPPVLVFIHGLFGDMNNLGVIARAFSEEYPILRIDLRNHGQSFHHHEMNYELMAQDVLHLLEHLRIDRCILVGHSMGGKTAMRVASLCPEKVEKLVVIDIAPVINDKNGHQDVFNGLFAVKQAQPQSRQQAKPILAQHIQEDVVQQFMLKSFDTQMPEYFRFNLSALHKNYEALMDWQKVYVTKPTLFLKGGNSDYIQSKDKDIILQQFPNARLFTINGCGHWLHAEKPQYVVRAIEKFISE